LSVWFRLKPDNSKFYGFELHRPWIKGTKLLLKIIKAIIIIIDHLPQWRGNRSIRPVRRGLRGLPLPRIFMFLGGMKTPLVPFHSRDLGVPRRGKPVKKITSEYLWPQINSN